MGTTGHSRGRAHGRCIAVAVVAATALATVHAGFGPAETVDVGRRPVDVAVLDFDSDGRDDLAVAVELDGAVVLLRGVGDGTFVTHATIATPRRPTALASADVDGDGDEDVVVAHGHDDSVSVLRATGAGSFVASSPTVVGRGPLRPAVGDVDGDRAVELVVGLSKDEALVTVDVVDGRLVPATIHPLGVEPVAAALVDLDADGRDEIAVVASDAIHVLADDGAGGLASVDVLPVGRGAAALLVADVDVDGFVDLVTADRTDRTATVWHGSSAGPGARVSHAVGVAAAHVLHGDFDGDCRSDLLVIGDTATGGELLAGTAGGFLAPVPVPLDTGASSWATTDLDGDLRPDLVGADPVSGVDVALGTSVARCNRFRIRRSPDPASVDAVAPLAETSTAPWTDPDAGLAGDVLFYRVRHAGGLDVRISAHADGAGVRLGFADGDPASAPVDPTRTSVEGPGAVVADGASIAEVRIVPRDGAGVPLGRGLAIVATHTGVGSLIGVYDLGDGGYAVRSVSDVMGTAEVACTVEGIALPPVPIAFVAP